VVSLYAATNDIITLEIRLEGREALASKIDLIPEIDLAFVLLAAVAVAISLIRHGNKHYSGNLEGSVSYRRSTVL